MGTLKATFSTGLSGDRIAGVMGAISVAEYPLLHNLRGSPRGVGSPWPQTPFPLVTSGYNRAAVERSGLGPHTFAPGGGGGHFVCVPPRGGRGGGTIAPSRGLSVPAPPPVLIGATRLGLQWSQGMTLVQLCPDSNKQCPAGQMPSVTRTTPAVTCGAHPPGTAAVKQRSQHPAQPFHPPFSYGGGGPVGLTKSPKRQRRHHDTKQPCGAAGRTLSIPIPPPPPVLTQAWWKSDGRPTLACPNTATPSFRNFRSFSGLLFLRFQSDRECDL